MPQIFLFFFFFIGFQVNSSFAQISVDQVIITFEPGQNPVRNVVVQNSGADTLGVEINPEEVIRAGFKDEHKVATKDLIVSPKRISLPPGSQRTIRLLLKSLPETEEKVFRIALLPKLEGFTPEEQSTSSKKTEIKVITTVGLLVFAVPQKPNPQLVWKKESNKIIFNNTGNTNFYLEQENNCESTPGKEEQKCSSTTKATRLYPGNTWTVDAPKNQKATFRKQSFSGYETIEVK